MSVGDVDQFLCCVQDVKAWMSAATASKTQMLWLGSQHIVVRLTDSQSTI